MRIYFTDIIDRWEIDRTRQTRLFASASTCVLKDPYQKCYLCRIHWDKDYDLSEEERLAIYEKYDISWQFEDDMMRADHLLVDCYVSNGNTYYSDKPGLKKIFEMVNDHQSFFISTNNLEIHKIPKNKLRLLKMKNLARNDS